MKEKSMSDKSKAAGSKAKRAFHIVHVDIVGPFRRKSLGGAQYRITLYDDYVSLSLFMFTKTKCDASAAIKGMVTEQESVFDYEVSRMLVRRLRSDSGGDFLSKPFKKVA